MEENPARKKGKDFIREIIDADMASGKVRAVVTRFPPEPNGYLHIGHAKSICLNFGLAADYSGRCHLRFDDTNPAKEETEYIDSIKQDVRWLGFDWGEHLYFASDYFEELYGFAVELIKKGKAYVCDLTTEEIKRYRGTLTEPGRPSPYRDRSVEENLDLFRKMKEGVFEDGKCVLRARIDMASPNLVMRDPAIYRIKHQPHPRTKESWCIYPMYDFAHCLSDSIEGITHSVCTLEFEINRPLYDWILDALEAKCHPRQVEFARLNLTYTQLSKRKLLALVEKGAVCGWDDPRMPTLSGLRRRGYPPEVIREFCSRIGVAKTHSVVDVALLEHCLREELNRTARRALAVLRPLRVVIENFPEGRAQVLEVVNNPEDPSMGTRKVPFSRVIYIERDDFMEDPPKKFFRLSPGREVRLRYAYYIKCTGVEKDPSTGEVKELRCTYDPDSRGGGTPDGRKVKGTLHWVSASHAVSAEVRLYGRLFSKPDPDDAGEGEDFLSNLDPGSLQTLYPCMVEPGLASARPMERFQFERQGYFCVDRESTADKPVFNRITELRDTWAKIQKRA